MMRDHLINSLVEQRERHADAVATVDEMLYQIDRAGYRLITKERYEEWKHDSHVLALAEMYGVDNWEGWDLVVQDLKEKP